MHGFAGFHYMLFDLLKVIGILFGQEILVSFPSISCSVKPNCGLTTKV